MNNRILIFRNALILFTECYKNLRGTASEITNPLEAMIDEYLHEDEQILVKVLAQYNVTTVGLWGAATDYIFYATNKRLLCHHISHNHIPDQVYELPYSNITITLIEKRRIRWYLALIGILLLGLGWTVQEKYIPFGKLLIWIIGILLIIFGFKPFKDAWYQIDGPTMTESERRIWQIPKYVQNADKFYAVVSEKVGKFG